ncbi:ankyrin repeat-containing protein ITN1-like [Prosopis cineraria]|uniref:ankyrin repeat-containing protein ITN1-like n=1 Tax=Prosopis cineraria TaxID=364024 RepID=UPI00240F6CB3|nr:ankyrin repeat-containing protein ITN1-like [Prosopis cineraria]
MHQIMRDLWEAACSGGDVSTLNSLIQRDPSILSNITALHISALLNRHDFTEVLLNHNPQLATRTDSSRRTALHLASAEGNSETVQKLLEFNHEPCLSRDTEKRIPLHYAAMRGKTKVVKYLIKKKPESLCLPDGAGSTVFHLCVIHNHLQTLETLVKFDHATASITDGDHLRDPIFTRPDRNGNTILHLAITFKRVEAVRYLLSIQNIRELANKKNSKGCTAHGILEHSPKDFMTLEMQHLLINSGTIEAETNEMQPFECLDLVEGGKACPGDAVSAIGYTSYFHPYLAICFIGFLCVLLLLLSGVPLKHRFVIWSLSPGMRITLTFLTLTYLEALYVVTPDVLFESPWEMVIVSVKTWIIYLALVAVFITLRFGFWLGKKLKEFINRLDITFRTRNRNEKI